jgi:hypothetical protein
VKHIYLLTLCLMMAACGGTTAAPTTKAVTADSIITAFKTAGLEAEGVTRLTREDYGQAPFVCEGVRFLIPSLGANKGGRVFVCPNTGDRDKLATYYQSLGKSSAALFSHVFTKGNALIQINGELKDDQAKRYEAALP